MKLTRRARRERPSLIIHAVTVVVPAIRDHTFPLGRALVLYVPQEFRIYPTLWSPSLPSQLSRPNPFTPVIATAGMRRAPLRRLNSPQS